MTTNENNTHDFDAAKRLAKHNYDLLIDSLEELNFRQNSFLRSLHAASQDPDSIRKRADNFVDVLSDVVDLMAIYLSETK